MCVCVYEFKKVCMYELRGGVEVACCGKQCITKCMYGVRCQVDVRGDSRGSNILRDEGRYDPTPMMVMVMVMVMVIVIVENSRDRCMYVCMHVCMHMVGIFYLQHMHLPRMYMYVSSLLCSLSPLLASHGVACVCVCVFVGG